MDKNYQALKSKISSGTLLFKSITFDNGMEFNSMYKLKEELGIKIYYCHPYTPSERGTNEVWNGLFPKDTDWCKITDYQLNKVTNIINKTPRNLKI